MISATVVAHSYTNIRQPVDSAYPAFPAHRVDLVTYELVCPKWMVAELNTDRMKARNSASSRAMPLKHTIALVESDPFIPSEWRYAQRGMTPAESMSEEDKALANEYWLAARDAAVTYAKKLAAIGGGRGAAKEHANRLLEPFMWTTVVMTATEWDNFFNLRDNPAAQLEFQLLARAMKDALKQSNPVYRRGGYSDESAWHLPYVTDFERMHYKLEVLPYISARRCAAVSYRRQGEPIELEREIAKGKELRRNRHWSPLEMPAIATGKDEWYGPFYSWKPFRKMFAGESGSPRHGAQETDPRWA